MAGLTILLFYNNNDDAATHDHHFTFTLMAFTHHPNPNAGLRLSLLGLLINIVLAAIKLLAGLIGNSYALIADAVESMADIFGSVVVWGGLKIASAPPDERHPYGHGKAEALAALVVAAMLIAASIGIGVAAVREILAPQRPPAAFTLWVLLGVVAAKELLFQAGRRLSQRSGSTAVTADAWHHRSDAITSLAAAIGIGITLIGGPRYVAADGIAALFASGIILFNGIRLIRPPLHELMDTAPVELIEKVRAAAAVVPGVKGIETVQARKSGTHYWVDMHVEVDPAMSVHDAHALAHRVKDAIRSQFPAVRDVLIHIEPFGERDDDVDSTTV